MTMATTDDDVDCMVQRALAHTLVRFAPAPAAIPAAPVDAHPSRTTVRMGDDGPVIDERHDGRPLDEITAMDMIGRASGSGSECRDPMRVYRYYPVPASSMGSWAPPRSLLDDDGRGPTDDVGSGRRHNFDAWIEQRDDILENVERLRALSDCLNDRTLFACVSAHGTRVLFDHASASITRGLRFRRIRKTYNDDDQEHRGPMLNALLWQAVSDDDEDDDDVEEDARDEDAWWRRPPTFETVPLPVLEALTRPFWEAVDEHLWRPFGRQSVMLFGQRWSVSSFEDDDDESEDAANNHWTISPGNVLLGDDPWSGMMRDACNCIVQAVRYDELSWPDERGETPFVYECLRMEPVHRPPEAAVDAAYVVPLVPLDVDLFWSVAREQLQETLSSRPIHSLSIGLHRRIAFREPDGTIGPDARWAWSVTITWCWRPPPQAETSQSDGG